MGRRAYLIRLALGRSAYEPVPDAADNAPVPSSSSPSTDSSGFHQQQYDRKGNPVNPEIATATLEQIAAKNEVLAAVGVCERKDKKHDPKPKDRVKFSEEEWQVLRTLEEFSGENGRIFTECCRYACEWWIVNLRKRIQVGLVSSSLPFSTILHHEWRAITSSGFIGGLKYVSAGALPEVLLQAVLLFTDWLLDEVYSNLSERICSSSSRVKPRERQRMLDWLDWLRTAAGTFSNIIFSPLAISSVLQQLGLTTATPTSWMLPWSPLSALQWAGLNTPSVTSSSLFRTRQLALLLSPIPLYFIGSLIHQELVIAAGRQTPFVPESAIVGPLSSDPDADDDLGEPAHPVLVTLARGRDSLLRLLGWGAPVRASRTAVTEAILSGDRSTANAAATYRRTELARFPAYFLSLNLDTLVTTLLFMPLDSLFLRSLTSAYYSHGKPAASSEPTPSFFAPGHGPLARVLRSTPQTATRVPEWRLDSAYSRRPFSDILVATTKQRGRVEDWALLGGYASKIGLCLALQGAADTVIWSMAWAWTRWVGLGQFHWGVV